jgi:hypothetical protein
MEAEAEKLLNELKNYYCQKCNSKSISGFLRVRSEKEIKQAVEVADLPKAAVHALKWVIFQEDEPKRKE